MAMSHATIVLLRKLFYTIHNNITLLILLVLSYNIKLVCVLYYSLLNVFFLCCFRLSTTQPRGLRRFRRGQQQQWTHVYRHRAQGSASTAPVSPPRSDYVHNNYNNIIILYNKLTSMLNFKLQELILYRRSFILSNGLKNSRSNTKYFF